MKAPARRPCGSCPYRKDVPSGVWHWSEYAKLPEFDRPLAEQPPSVFFCHQQDGHLCAGWAGCHDMKDSLGMRAALAQSRIRPEEFEATMDYVSPVPLFESGLLAMLHGVKDLLDPPPEAVRIMDKLKRKGLTRD